MQEKQDKLQEPETDFVVTSVEEQPEPVEEEVVTTAGDTESVEEVVSEQAEEPVVEDEPKVESEPVVDEPALDDVEEFAKKDEDTPSEEDADDETDSTDDVDDYEADKKKPAAKHSLLDDEAIMAELEELRQFKRNIESAKKDEVINKYHMLSDEDKAEVIAHKDEYTLQQIDEKLALVYVNKNVDFSTVDGLPEEKQEVEPSILSFSLDDNNLDNAEPVDEIQAALREFTR